MAPSPGTIGGGPSNWFSDTNGVRVSVVLVPLHFRGQDVHRHCKLTNSLVDLGGMASKWLQDSKRPFLSRLESKHPGGWLKRSPLYSFGRNRGIM